MQASEYRGQVGGGKTDFGERRHARKLGETRRCADRQGLQPSFPDVLDRQLNYELTRLFGAADFGS